MLDARLNSVLNTVSAFNVECPLTGDHVVHLNVYLEMPFELQCLIFLVKLDFDFSFGFGVQLHTKCNFTYIVNIDLDFRYISMLRFL